MEVKNDLIVFNHKEFGELKAIEINGEPWFVGKDIAEKLGYVNAQKAVRTHVDEEDKGVTVLDTPGGKQNVTIINESGVYSLVIGSKLESAKRFKRWITSEVLPSLRKYGSYSIVKPDSYMIEDKKCSPFKPTENIIDIHSFIALLISSTTKLFKLLPCFLANS